METDMGPILSWSGAITNEEIYNIARDPSNSRYRWAMDQILNYDYLENIEKMFTPQEILDVLPSIHFRPASRKKILETALSYWTRGIHHAYPPSK